MRVTTDLPPVHLFPLVAEAHKETIEEKITRIAEEENFDPQIIINNINTETGGTWDCSVPGRDGELGCYQVIPSHHPEVDPMDFEAATRFFIKSYKEGNEWWWTGCSCVSTVRLKVPSFPHLDAKWFVNFPKTTPAAGTVAIFMYPTTFHVAYVLSVENDGYWVFEGNWEPCKIAKRFIPWDNDPHLVGFWSPV